MKEELSCAEVCAALGISERTLARLRSSGKITPCPTVGTRVAYHSSDVKRLAEERSKGKNADA